MQTGKRTSTEEEKKSQPSSEMDVTSKAVTGIAHPPLVTDPKVANPARIMGSFLENKQLPKVLTTSHGVRTLFSKALTPILLQACVNGERDKVNAILTQFPELLHEKGTVIDYSGRVHRDRTVYQLALGACDYNVIVNGKIVVEGMVEMIDEHFKRLTMPQNFVAQRMKFIEQEETAGNLSKDQAEQERINLRENPKVYYINKVMRDQYEGQFPPGHEAKEAKRVEQDRDAHNKFMKVIEAAYDVHVTSTSNLENKIHKIIRTEKSELADELRRLVSTVMKASSDEAFNHAFDAFKRFLIAQDGFINKDDVFDFELLKALYQFRNHLEPKEEQTFGKHFNHQLLADVAQSYNDNYARFGSQNGPKNMFCWQKPFGLVERGAPASDAQVIAQGPWSILEGGNKSCRSLKFTDGVGSYYPLAADPNLEIGYNCGAAGWRRVRVGGAAGWSLWVVPKLMLSKNTSAHAYATSISSATKEKPLRSIVEYR